MAWLTLAPIKRARNVKWPSLWVLICKSPLWWRIPEWIGNLKRNLCILDPSLSPSQNTCPTRLGFHPFSGGSAAQSLPTRTSQTVTWDCFSSCKRWFKRVRAELSHRAINGARAVGQSSRRFQDRNRLRWRSRIYGRALHLALECQSSCSSSKSSHNYSATNSNIKVKLPPCRR